MMQIRKSIYIVCMLLLALACTEDRLEEQTGILILDVQENASLLTKSLNPVVDEILRVDIISESGDTIKKYSDYLREVRDEKLILPVGSYTVAVSSNSDGSAAWEAPFYAGSEDVEVKAGQITQAKVTCQIANTKVTVEYSPELKRVFSDYQTLVSNESGELLYTRDEYRAGYFTPATLTAALHLVNSDGNRFTIQRVYQNVEPRTHYNLRYELANPNPPGEEDQAGLDIIEIEKDESHEEIHYTIFIKEESLSGKGEPRLYLTNFGEEHKITYKENSMDELPEAQLSLYAPAGVRSLRLKAESHQLSASSYELMALSETEKNELEAVGFPLTIGEPDESGLYALDLQPMITRLKPNGTKIASHTFTLILSDALNQEVSETFTFEIRPDVKINVLEPIVWAKFATLRGTTADGVGQKFMLRKVGENDYRSIDEVKVNTATGDVTALVTNLDANTVYEYYLVSGEEGQENKSEPIQFTTDDIPTVPNLNFDSWCESGGIIYPNESQSAAFWDSGNGGAAKANKTPTESTTEVATSSSQKAACLHSEMATIAGVGAFAAGNIYAGSFKEAIISVSNPGAKLDFGRPYTGRPTKLSGYYRYIPKAVDNGGHEELTKGSMDKCSIYIALCDWTAPFAVNTQTSTFVDLSTNNSSIIAYGELSDEQARQTNMPAYERFEIDIKYRDTNRKPSYILIVASSSKYGDYFTGGEGSTLYLDELELSFDYNPKSFE